mgnify:CR=1 FL=1
MEYQSPIQVVLILIILAGAIYAAVKAVNHAREKKDILSQINETVTEINTAVSNLNEKKADVIYIDNRVPGQAPYRSDCRGEKEHIIKEASSSDDHSGDAEKSCEKTETVTDQVSLQMEADLPEQAEQAAEVVQAPAPEAGEEDASCEREEDAYIPKKYFSRDCAVSKNGKTYTIEELNEQIKE